MKQTIHHVVIKGTRDGLVFFLDDQCGYAELIQELEMKLDLDHQQFFQGPLTHVILDVGYRYITPEQELQLEQLLHQHGALFLRQIRSKVVCHEDAEQMQREQAIQVIPRTIRSGQEVFHENSLLILGDVNSGSQVTSHGNIYVMGHLRGIAHAGYGGRRDTIIAASIMEPAQLRIASVIAQEMKKQGHAEMLFAYLEGEEIHFDHLHKLHHAMELHSLSISDFK